MSYSGQTPDTERADDWRDHGSCRTHDYPDMWFATAGNHEGRVDQHAAQAICFQCPVLQQCGQWALDTDQTFGIWGGLTEQERRKLKRRPVRVISIDDYTGTREPRVKAASPQEAWASYTHPEGEHLLWTGPKVMPLPGTRQQTTPNRIAFFLDRGRWPEGDTKRTCGVAGCVRPAHLADRVERAEEADLAVAV